jgi:arylsulfatase A-like enzyme
LSFAGVRAPDTMQGRDLSQLLSERKGEMPEAVYVEGRLGERDEWRMLVHGYDKLVTDLEGRVTYLFNLADDPFERTNLAAASSAELKRDALLAQQKDWVRRLNDGMDRSGLRQR